MGKKILAPLDGSDLSECALEHIKAIATGCQVPEVVLLRVVEPIPVVAGDWSPPENWRRDAERRALDAAKNHLAGVAANLKEGGVTAKTVVVSGRAADEILDYIKKNDVDLVIISTHGRSGVSRWVLGSVADRVVRHSRAPVLTVAPAGCRID